MDILDTSVIRGLRRRDILAIRRERTVAVSPLTLWEILCHLDEVRGNETSDVAFPRRRGHVAILKHLEVLHDPFAQHADVVGAAHLANPTRFEDREVARQVISEVMSVSSLAELHRRPFTYPDGTRASFQGIAGNARAALDQEERRFLNDLHSMWQRLQQHGGYSRPSDLSDEDIWSWLKAMVTALRNSYAHDGISEPDLFVRVCDSIYPYYGYLLFRLRTYGIGADGRLAVQPNDAEDGLICMHLRLFGDMVLVVGDGKTQRALQQAIGLWNAKVPEVPARCSVMLLQDYRAIAKVIRTREAAYYRWKDRNCPNGDDLADWFEAERQLEP